MLRLAERRPTASDRAAGELVDRTGIIAASLPRGRRSPEDLAVRETSCESTQPIPIVAGCAPAKERPRAVAVRRRARAWVGGSAAVILVGLGWLAGGLFTGGFLGHPTDDAAAQTDQRVPVTVQQAPAPAPPPVTETAAPVTVYVPVPAHETPTRRSNPVRPTTPRETSAPAPSKTADPRADLGPDSPGNKQKSSVDDYLDWKPWFDAARRMSGGR
ncbi:hypothetical protein [Amycolatopsis jejuensis]|uniref:hypothetical protein n=1 Tax=Amycolatopsis jejuensis TaxID=330084 RepID=UPI0005243B65|nr:hypothetical protein [Amycolatopsis jejuensis]